MGKLDNKDRPLTDAILTGVEVVADVAMNGDLLASIPVVSVAFKALKARDSVRDQLFLKKLYHFATALETVSDEQREKMRAKLAGDEGGKIGGMLLLTLDKITQIGKAQLLAKIFLAYIDGHFGSETLQRLIMSIDVGFLDDLIAHASVRPNRSASVSDPALVAAGLTQISRVTPDRHMPDLARAEIVYEETNLGRQFRAAVGLSRPHGMGWGIGS